MLFSNALFPAIEIDLMIDDSWNDKLLSDISFFSAIRALDEFVKLIIADNKAAFFKKSDSYLKFHQLNR